MQENKLYDYSPFKENIIEAYKWFTEYLSKMMKNISLDQI